MIPKLDEYKKRWELYSENSIKPGLEAITEALLKVGNPEKSSRIIHVAGTNGKGSTIAFMESVLRQHGYSTGVFSSPAIIDIHDQIRIDGKSITEVELNKSFMKMKEAGLSGMLTDFELLTVSAFITFQRLQPDYVLLETGLGGRLDSTNVITPIVSVITSIALDHTSFLGTTLAEIAEHKAGIIKESIPVVLGPLPDEALQVVCRIAKMNGSRIHIFGEQFKIENGIEELYIGIEKYKLTGRKMKGEHQGVDAAVAIETLLLAGIELTENLVTKAISSTQLPHRFQEIAPNIFLDGAHNPAAANALANTIQKEFPGEKVDFIVGMLRGKDIERILDILTPLASSFTFLTFSHPEAAIGVELMKYCKHPIKSVTIAQNDTIILYREKKTRTIVTGSLYLLAAIKFDFKKQKI